MSNGSQENKLGEKLGFLFEVGFNIGMLTYIKQNDIKHHYGDLYSQDLKQLKFSRMIDKLAIDEKVVSDSNRKIIKDWVLFFLQKSFLSGLNFLQEYFKSVAIEKEHYKKLEILYYQCFFHGDNSLGTYNDKGETEIYKTILQQLTDIDNVDRYKKTGEFLKADTLIFIEYKKTKSQKIKTILSIDYSIFAIREIQDLDDMRSVDVLKRILLKEIAYLRKKSVFANLGMDSKTPTINLSENLKYHYKAFVTKDKESMKMIQAGSYAYSFYNFLRSKKLLEEQESIDFKIIGYSDRGISSLSLINKKEHINILETCYNIYTNKQPKEVQKARKDILMVIKRQASKSFTDGEIFLNQLMDFSSKGIHSFTHEETINNFLSPIDTLRTEISHNLNLDPKLDLRNAHKELIQRELESDKPYLFLTGNPGIGKTTAITDFLKQPRITDEGFLFFYISPRTQVNLDIFEKFTDKKTGKLYDDKLFAITTNSILIKSNDGNLTVNYRSNMVQDKRFEYNNVHFINQNHEIAYQPSNIADTYRHNEDTIKDQAVKTKGVLQSICEATNTLIKNKISNNIIATVAMQSFKKSKGGKNTFLAHFNKIFNSAYNSRKGIFLENNMREISSRIKHIFVMIDEITGDESGVYFLHEINKFFRQFKDEYGFNYKIIVADASIVNPDVINQHFSSTVPEPNKIFFRQSFHQALPLSVENFEFKNKPAMIINSNAYPANSLKITYKLFIESIEFHEKLYSQKNQPLRDAVQKQIIKDIKNLFKNNPSEQTIVYVQDKERLAELIIKIKSFRKFEEKKDYIEIHANLGDKEKKEIKHYLAQETIKVIFMTSSASRGLSFPKVKNILVEIPRFEVEKNLMEVIQVIYRGRGNDEIDRQDKQLIFYLTEQAIYDQEEDEKNRKLAIQESILSFINLLLILKTSIMTRIQGSGNIGKQQFLMIPVSGKSVSAAGETFSSKLSNLIKQLKKEARKSYDNEKFIEAYTYLEQLLKECDFTLKKFFKDSEKSGISPLDLRTELSSQFLKLMDNSFEELLNYYPMERCHISGSLLVVPIEGKAIEERYKIKTDKRSESLDYTKIINNLEYLKKHPKLPENITRNVSDVTKFLDTIFEKDNSVQNYEQNSQYDDQYYAIPLYAFIIPDLLEEYFQGDDDQTEKYSFKDILTLYLRSLYPVSSLLPIGSQYEQFPFIIFRSYSLNELRSKLFTDKYLLNSNDINVLSLILSSKPEDDR
ncbi:MAG: helicase-related protein [Crocosphaera sp.]|nr:helicase-related protein [Crocosphaera sp.]